MKENIDIMEDKNNLEENYEIIKQRDKEIFNILNKEIFDLKLKVYDLNKNKANTQINDNNFFRDVILYNLCLSNIEHLISCTVHYTK